MQKLSAIQALLDQVPPEQRSAVTGLVDLKAEDGVDKVLAKLESMEKRIDSMEKSMNSRMDTMKTSMDERIGAMSSNIKLLYKIQAILLSMVGGILFKLIFGG